MVEGEPDAGLSGQMKNDVHPPEDLLQGRRLANVQPVQRQRRVSRDGREVGLLATVIGFEVVDDPDPIALGEKRFDEMRSDESGAAGNGHVAEASPVGFGGVLHGVPRSSSRYVIHAFANVQ